jgi:hypothetical protein
VVLETHQAHLQVKEIMVELLMVVLEMLLLVGGGGAGAVGGNGIDYSWLVVMVQHLQ